MTLFSITGSYDSDHEGQSLFPLVSASGQKLLVFVLSHFFTAFLYNASQKLVLLSFMYSPGGVDKKIPLYGVFYLLNTTNYYTDWKKARGGENGMGVWRYGGMEGEPNCIYPLTPIRPYSLTFSLPGNNSN